MSQGLRLAHAGPFVAVAAAVVAPIVFGATTAHRPDPTGVGWGLAELVRRRQGLAEQLRRSGRPATEESLRIALFVWLPELMVDPEHGPAVTDWLGDLVLGLPDGALAGTLPATTIAAARDAIAEARLWSGTPMPILDRLASAPARPAAPTNPFPATRPDPDAPVPWTLVPPRAAPPPPSPASPLLALVAGSSRPGAGGTLVLPADLSAALERAAAADGRPLHAVIVAALEQYVAGREPATPR